MIEYIYEHPNVSCITHSPSLPILLQFSNQPSGLKCGQIAYLIKEEKYQDKISLKCKKQTTTTKCFNMKALLVRVSVPVLGVSPPSMASIVTV